MIKFLCKLTPFSKNSYNIQRCAMQILSQNTVVVFTSSELKDALANSNGYDYIYLGENITLESRYRDIQ